MLPEVPAASGPELKRIDWYESVVDNLQGISEHQAEICPLGRPRQIHKIEEYMWFCFEIVVWVYTRFANHQSIRAGRSGEAR